MHGRPRICYLARRSAILARPRSRSMADGMSATPHDRPILALLIRLLGIAGLATMAALVKLAASRGMHLVELLFWRQAIAIPILLVWAGTQLGERWEDIRHALQPFDLLIAVAVVALVAIFVWWRLGMPGRPRRAS